MGFGSIRKMIGIAESFNVIGYYCVGNRVSLIYH